MPWVPIVSSPVATEAESMTPAEDETATQALQAERAEEAADAAR